MAVAGGRSSSTVLRLTFAERLGIAAGAVFGVFALLLFLWCVSNMLPAIGFAGLLELGNAVDIVGVSYLEGLHIRTVHYVCLVVGLAAWLAFRSRHSILVRIFLADLVLLLGCRLPVLLAMIL